MTLHNCNDASMTAEVYLGEYKSASISARV